jgi:hypothetical protein
MICISHFTVVANYVCFGTLTARFLITGAVEIWWLCTRVSNENPPVHSALNCPRELNAYMLQKHSTFYQIRLCTSFALVAPLAAHVYSLLHSITSNRFSTAVAALYASHWTVRDSWVTLG